jgi:hypothetical protein
VAGQEHGHHLVAELAVGHLLAGVLVAGLHEHPQQVPPPPPAARRPAMICPTTPSSVRQISRKARS